MKIYEFGLYDISNVAFVTINELYNMGFNCRYNICYKEEHWDICAEKPYSYVEFWDSAYCLNDTYYFVPCDNWTSLWADRNDNKPVCLEETYFED